MTPERFRQIRNLFEAAIDRAPSKRQDFLDEACRGDDLLHAEVNRLLEGHQRRFGPLDQPAIAIVPTESYRMEGRRVGAYEVLRELGAGGMATVYLARRADGAFDRNVALKFVRPEDASHEILSRFQQEQQILAALEHPNIARLLDAGSTDAGSPYFVMEFVEGIPIDQYCDEHRLSVGKRLKLFETVCSAVHYANQRGVVHRDLKPSNILVTADGVVKLLDFGISKLLDNPREPLTAYLTRTGLRLMTPEYASPEQVKGEIVTAATDVYSLGVVLYEVLTGQRPYRMRSRVMHEIVRVICEEPPTRPSTSVTHNTTADALSRARDSTPGQLKRELFGDIDSILLKSLEKESSARYRSVEELGKEVSRHLRGEPVEARSYHLVRLLFTFTRRESGWILATLCSVAAIASGAVTIQRNALILMSVLLASLLTGVLVLKAEFGNDFARRSLRGLTRLFALMFIAIMILSALPRSVMTSWLSILAGAPIILCGYYVLRWPLRSHWAGELMLDVSRRRQPWVMFLCAMMIVGGLMSITDKFVERAIVSSTDILRALAPLSMALFMLTLHGRAEFRSGGIVSSGRLIRWRSIKSYAWRPAMGEFEVLQVWSKGLGRFWPAEKLLLRREVKEQVTELLERQLSPWLG